MNFYNRNKERAILKNYILQKQRINIVFSKKGYGKTELIKYVITKECGLKYININAHDIFIKDKAPDFYYMNSIAKSIMQELPREYLDYQFLKFYEKIPDFQIYVTIPFLQVGTNIGKFVNSLKQSIINSFNRFNEKVYLHIENVEKIDSQSLKFLVELVNETANVFLFFECISEKEYCYEMSTYLLENHIKSNCYELPKMDWNYVECILHDYNIYFSEEDKETYIYNGGDIKALMFNSKLNSFSNLKLETNEQFILNFLKDINIGLSDNNIFQILNSYKGSLNLNLGLKDISRITETLLKNGLIIKKTDKYYVNEQGEKLSNDEHHYLITEILSGYYIPYILDATTDAYNDTAIIGLQILVPLYAKNEDKRINKIIGCIEKILPSIFLNEKIIDVLYTAIEKCNDENYIKLKIILLKLYVKLGCYKKAFELLPQFSDSNIKVILYCTILVHLLPENYDVEGIIRGYIDNSNNKDLTSALYTCLLGFYMRTKSSKDTIKFYEDFCKSNRLINDSDKHIIEKNVSIYYETSVAKKMIISACKHFKKHNQYRLAIGSYITLSTRCIQNGELNLGKRILITLEKSWMINEENQAYIDNNLSVISLLNDSINSNTLRRLKDTYYFCEDPYSKLLVTNNLLIYSIKDNDYVAAGKYASEIEKAGFNKFKFDDYLHVALTNLIYYYSFTRNSEKINLYIDKLHELYKSCNSIELKKYISKQLEGQQLDGENRWKYLSDFDFRPAFMGHWFINNFDYS
ncbi:MAG: hypothetical protein ACI35S_02680 [Anaeroplasma sp.]